MSVCTVKKFFQHMIPTGSNGGGVWHYANPLPLLSVRAFSVRRHFGAPTALPVHAVLESVSRTVVGVLPSNRRRLAQQESTGCDL